MSSICEEICKVSASHCIAIIHGTMFSGSNSGIVGLWVGMAEGVMSCWAGAVFDAIVLYNYCRCVRSVIYRCGKIVLVWGYSDWEI